MKNQVNEALAAKAAVQAAKDALEQAERDVKEAEVALKKARDAVGLAHSALRAARATADCHLPKAQIITISGYRGTVEKRQEGVIVRRTATTIFARAAGEGEHMVKQYRLTKFNHSGNVWREYPRPGTFCSRTELALPESGP